MPVGFAILFSIFVGGLLGSLFRESSLERAAADTPPPDDDVASG